jgi:hypothetical protein
MANFMEIVRALDGKRSAGEGYDCKCPNCEDHRTRHLHLSEGPGGKILYHCHKCKDQNAVGDALIKLGLWKEKKNGSTPPTLRPASLPPVTEDLRFILPVPKDQETELHAAAKGAAAVWDYRDEQGHLLYIRARFDEPDGGKRFLPFAMTDKGPVSKDPYKGKPSPLYHLAELAAAGPSAPVMLVEGERCAEVGGVYLQDAGLPHVAMTWPGGAGAAKNSNIDWEPLRGRSVVIWPDKDKPGAEAADAIAKRLVSLGCHISKIEPPAELPEKGDIADLNADDWSAAQIRAIIEKASAPQLRFKWDRLSDIEFTAPDWLVCGMIEREDLACIFGDPSTYKSFLSVNISACIGTGTPFHGQETKQGPVFYVAGEGRKGIKRRFRAWEMANGIKIPDDALFIAHQPADLNNEQAVADLIESLQYACSMVGEPQMIVFDTLARSFGAGDESSTADMNAVVMVCDRLRSLFGCTVLLIHHPGIADKNRLRGAFVLTGALDSLFRMDKDSDGISRLECMKVKEGEFAAPRAFKLRQVDLGLTDERGADVTSCVLEDIACEAHEARSEHLSKWELVMLQALREETENDRRNVELSGRDPATACVSIQAWRQACLNTYKVPKQRFYDRMPELMRKRVIQTDHGYVSIRT